ncbi:MAG: HmuY family protein [Muribaculaceae bacterium]|nr:HmuY family protein [Muribaculaceae bacterium]
MSSRSDFSRFQSFIPTKAQPEPDNWSIAVHRDNVRTNGCVVWMTPWKSHDELPDELSGVDPALFEEDVWTETDVWAVQERMLLGLVGSQYQDVNCHGARALDLRGDSRSHRHTQRNMAESIGASPRNAHTSRNVHITRNLHYTQNNDRRFPELTTQNVRFGYVFRKNWLAVESKFSVILRFEVQMNYF